MMTSESRILYKKVYEVLRAGIANGTYPRGSCLPTEPELMERMAVGRSSVREALRGLAVLGLVEIRQGQGTFVRSLVPLAGPAVAAGDLIAGALARGLTDELLEAREVIEVRIAGMAAQRATKDDLADLEGLLEAARASHAGDRRGSLASADFHLGVARAAHNDVLEGFVASYTPVLAECYRVVARLPGYIDWEIREHDAIRQAISRHDARQAATLMRRHLKDMTIHYEHVSAAGLRLPGTRRLGDVEDPAFDEVVRG